jgi:hypothetical protein
MSTHVVNELHAKPARGNDVLALLLEHSPDSRGRPGCGRSRSAATRTTQTTSPPTPPARHASTTTTSSPGAPRTDTQPASIRRSASRSRSDTSKTSHSPRSPARAPKTKSVTTLPPRQTGNPPPATAARTARSPPGAIQHSRRARRCDESPRRRVVYFNRLSEWAGLSGSDRQRRSSWRPRPRHERRSDAPRTQESPALRAACRSAPDGSGPRPRGVVPR